MNNYRGNSDKSKSGKSEVPAIAPERKKREPVAKGIVKKKGLFRKAVNLFMPDNIPQTKEEVLNDIIVPKIKTGILEAVQTVLGIEGSFSKSAKRNNGRGVSYRDYYEKVDRQAEVRRRDVLDFDDISFESSKEAFAVLDELHEILAEYAMVRVSDFYDSAGYLNYSHTCENYGWTSLTTATVVKSRNYYYINLPKARPL